MKKASSASFSGPPRSRCLRRSPGLTHDLAVTLLERNEVDTRDEVTTPSEQIT